MEKFKVVVTKWSKKYSILLNADNEAEVRDKIHKEWYTILSVSKFLDKKITWNKFIFEAEINWLDKRWIIIWNDIYKAYIKLRKELNYNVKYLYSEVEKNENLEYKTKIIKELNDWYLKMNFLSSKKGKKVEKKKKVESVKDKWNIDDFYLKKELENTHKLINLVIKKIDFFIEKDKRIDPERKKKLIEIHNNIVRIKTSTNLFKLRNIWELALIKIGQIELEFLEKEKTKEWKIYLKETNKLLKQIGSNKQIIEKQKDPIYILKQFIWKIKSKFKVNQKENRLKAYEAKKIDKDSYNYLKTLLLLDKYKLRLRKNTLEIVKQINILLFPIWNNNKEKREHLLIKRKVIKQNISILKAKKNWKSFSYTWIKKWYDIIVKDWLLFIKNILNYLFYIILIFSFSLIIHYNFLSYWYKSINFNYIWIYYFIYILLFYIFTILSRGIITLILNFVIFSFIIIFWVVNF